LFSAKYAFRFARKEGEIAQKGEGGDTSGEFFCPSRKSNRRSAKMKRRKNLLNRRLVIVQPRNGEVLLKDRENGGYARM